MNVRNVLNEYDAAVAMLLEDEERKASFNGPFLEFKLRACHRPFTEAWEDSRHAGAFNCLKGR